MIRSTGADILITLLERQGIDCIAGIPGGSNLPLYDALSKSSIRHVLCRHEQGAGFIAQGIARSTGKPAVCFATSGPGATNLLTALADAKMDSVPLICITGQVPLGLIGTDAFQEVDIYGMSIPVTKHNFLVRSVEELFTVIPEAFRIASSGRPGPVLVDVPKDVQTAILEFEEWPAPGRPDDPPALDKKAMALAARCINESHRPILYIGGGVTGRAAELARMLAEKASMPVVMTLMGLGSIPSDHPLALGMLGMHAARSTNLLLERCDLLLAVGARFDDRATGKVQSFCPKATIVHIDIDSGEINKIKNANVGIVGDATDAMAALLPLVQENARPEWRWDIEEMRERCLGQDEPGSCPPGTPSGLIRLIAQFAGPEAIVVTDVGQHQMWTAQAYPFQAGGRWLTSGGLGTMGFGLPAAIGASLACPGKPVVLVSGDGSFLMNIQELATAVQERANIKIMLMDNGSLGLVRQQQDLFYDQNVFASRYETRVDYTAVAAGFGLKTFKLAGGSPASVLSKAFAEPGPCLVHAMVDPAANVYPMVPPGAANSQMIGRDAYAVATA